MERKIKKQVNGFRTQDGAGVDLVRVLGHGTVEEYDPILMLDSFEKIYSRSLKFHSTRDRPVYDRIKAELDLENLPGLYPTCQDFIYCISCIF